VQVHITDRNVVDLTAIQFHVIDVPGGCTRRKLFRATTATICSTRSAAPSDPPHVPHWPPGG